MHCQVPANIRIYLTSFWAMTKYSPRGSSSSSSKRSARYTFNRRISPSILGNCAFKNVFLSDSNFGSFIFFWASVCSLVRLQGSRVRKSWVSINHFVQNHILRCSRERSSSSCIKEDASRIDLSCRKTYRSRVLALTIKARSNPTNPVSV